MSIFAAQIVALFVCVYLANLRRKFAESFNERLVNAVKNANRLARDEFGCVWMSSEARKSMKLNLKNKIYA